MFRIGMPFRGMGECGWGENGIPICGERQNMRMVNGRVKMG